MALGRTIFQSLVVLRQPGTWGSFAAMLAPGQTSPPATKHKETVGLKIPDWHTFEEPGAITGCRKKSHTLAYNTT